MHPGLILQDQSDHAQSQAEEVEQRENCRLLSGPCLVYLTTQWCSKLSFRTLPTSEPCLVNVSSYQSDSVPVFWIARMWSGGFLPSLGLEVAMLEEEPSFMCQNGMCRRAGQAMEFTKRALRCPDTFIASAIAGQLRVGRNFRKKNVLSSTIRLREIFF